MAKRFTDTNKYRKPFIRGLKGAYKLLWDYLYHDCDHAGIWIVDFEVAQIYIGSDMPVNKNDALKYFNDNEIRIIPFDNDSKWFIPSFVDFQYGELNSSNRAHNSVINLLSKQNLYSIDKGLTRGLQDPKDKDKDKDMDKDKKKEVNIPFIIFWDLYDKKVGDKEKVESKWKSLSNKDRQSIIDYIPKYKESQPDKKYRKNPTTFLNNKSWNDEIIDSKNSAGNIQGIKVKSEKHYEEWD